jgi:potassium-transporting ATPase KdpC subunit
MLKQLLPSLRAVLVLALYTGVIFPLVITAVAQLTFPGEANGSLVARVSGADSSKNNSASASVQEVVIGSRLLAQSFKRPEYFHPRPSATGYAGEASGGTNYGPTSRKLMLGDRDFDGIKQLAENYRKENSLAPGALVPVDAVTRSASGLDPHITVANALLQLSRVARARKLSELSVRTLLEKHTEPRQCWIMGEPRVNVLLLNLDLDGSH